MGVRLKPGDTIRGYRIIAFVGDGTEGDFYKAKTPEGETVGLKQGNRSITDADGAKDLTRVNRLKRLIGEHCEHVAEVLDIFTHSDLPYIITDFVEGQSLEDLLHREGPLTLRQLSTLIEDVFSGLAWLHMRGIVHRDIKPANIMVWKDAKGYRGKLIDLGVAFHNDTHRLTRTGGMLGTPAYMAAELFKGKDVTPDGRADLHAVGVMIYEALTGALPCTCKGIHDQIFWVLRGERPRLPDCLRAPTVLDEFLRTLMQVKPKHRYPSAEEALNVWRALPITETSSIAPSDSYKDEPSTSPSETMHPQLCVMSGDFKGKSIEVPEHGMCLGRIHLNPGDACISRMHVLVIPKRRGLALRDAQSRCGLILNDRRVRWALLTRGDTVVIGNTTLQYK